MRWPVQDARQGFKIIKSLAAVLGAAFRKQWLPICQMQSLLIPLNDKFVNAPQSTAANQASNAAVARLVVEFYMDGCAPGEHHSGPAQADGRRIIGQTAV